MLVIPPRGVPSPVQAATCIQAASDALTDLTGLRLISAEQAGVVHSKFLDCAAQQRFTCWTRAVRNVRNPARYLFVLFIQSSATTSDGLRLSLLLLDLELANEIIANEPRGPAREERVESKIFESTVHTRARVIASTPEALVRFHHDAAHADLRSVLGRNGHWQPFGRIAVTSDKSGRSIEIDGRVVGVTTAGTTTIERVTTGPREIVVRDVQSELTHTQVSVAHGQTSQVRVHDLSSGPHPVRTASLWTGGVVAAGGLALVGLAVAQSGDARAACLSRPGQDDAGCPAAAAPSFGETISPSTNPDSTGGSLPIAPIAAALAVTGATWLTGALLGPDEDAPWWAIGIGALAGGVVLAAGLALSP